MKLSLLFLICATVAVGCASSEKNSDNAQSYPNLVELTQPENQQEESTIYVDSVEAITYKKSGALLISGSFPDGCTSIKSAQHQEKDGAVQITLEPWRDPDSYCTQALTSFSFIYDKIGEQMLSSITSVHVNGRSYGIQ